MDKVGKPFTQVQQGLRASESRCVLDEEAARAASDLGRAACLGCRTSESLLAIAVLWAVDCSSSVLSCKK